MPLRNLPSGLLGIDYHKPQSKKQTSLYMQTLNQTNRHMHLKGHPVTLHQINVATPRFCYSSFS